MASLAKGLTHGRKRLPIQSAKRGDATEEKAAREAYPAGASRTAEAETTR